MVQANVPPPPKPPADPDAPDSMTRAKRRRLARAAKAKAAAAKEATSQGATDPAAPSGGKSTGKGLDIPSGAKTRDAQGRPVCFRYNRKACDQSKEKCSRGYHVCWFCLKNHADVMGRTNFSAAGHSPTTQPHRDVNNDPNAPNMFLALTSFSGGQVWQHDDHGAHGQFVQGQHLPGRLLDPTCGPCFLASHRLHFTLPWQGRRVLLVAFSPWYKDQDFDFSQLAALGFRVRRSPPRCLPQHVELLGHRLLLPPIPLREVSFACEASEALALEVFCGRGRLSVALRDQGLSVLPVDHRVRCTELQVVRLDLTESNDVSVFLEMLCTANVCVAHFGPPCGTASRARERPLPPELAHITSPPLRSESSPFGLNGLTASQAARVRSANLLYVVTLVSIWILSVRGSLLSCENPSSSLFWRVADLLAQDLPDPSAWSTLEDVHFHSCMWGSSRNKRTTFRATPGLWNGLAADCDGSHEHSSWTPSVTAQGVVFPTSGEAEYPRELASAYASFALMALQTKGLKTEQSQLSSGVLRPRDLRAFTKKRVPPLLAEYWLVLPASCLPAAWPHKLLPRWAVFPKRGDKVVLISG
ncbi:unnamed protein product [Symbiodinium microadriaticum]|nr:unnamed protein product [Symbiodinium sp. KB8]CAE7429668.1 unnamed protein product [Symbiodinium microadriaticum]